jgi:hypothetical protein
MNSATHKCEVWRAWWTNRHKLFFYPRMNLLSTAIKFGLSEHDMKQRIPPKRRIA